MSRESGVHRLPALRRITLVTGHYGCGKTNLSINLALDLRAGHAEVTLVDLDVVNPYFRSSDYTEMLTAHGVRVVAPLFAGTTLDMPALSGAVSAAFESAGPVVVDVGGDDAGATALGRFAPELAAVDYDMLYVINRCRNLTATPREAAALLPEIETVSRVRATGVVNNSHLQHETTLATVIDSLDFARETAGLLGLPLVCTTVPDWLADAPSGRPAAVPVENAYPVGVYVRTPWDDAHARGEKE